MANDEFNAFGLDLGSDDEEVVDDSPMVETDLIVETADVVNNPYIGENGMSIPIPSVSNEDLTLAVTQLSAPAGEEVAESTNFAELSGQQIPTPAKSKTSKNSPSIVMFESKAQSREAFATELTLLQNQAGLTLPVKLSSISKSTEKLRGGMMRVVGDLLRQKTFLPHKESGAIYQAGSTWVVGSDQTDLLLAIFDYFAADKTSSPVSQRVHQIAVAQRSQVEPQDSTVAVFDELGEIQTAVIPPKDLDPDYEQTSEFVEPIEYPDESFSEGCSPIDLQSELNPDLQLLVEA